MGHVNSPTAGATAMTQLSSFLDAESSAMLFADGDVPAVIDPPDKVIPAPLPLRKPAPRGNSLGLPSLLCA